MKQFVIPAFALAAIVAPAVGAEWGTDLPQALKQAAEQKKNVLVLFTGSDWCGPCISMKSNVLSKPEFEAYAKDKFVLVELDFPRQKKLPDGLLEKNRALGEKFAVQGYPTMLVLSPEEVVLGGFVGGRGSQADVEKALDVTAATAALAAANQATGQAKAEALYKLYQSLSDDVRASSGKLLDEIKALDPEDKLGLKKAEAEEAAAMQEMQRIGNELQAAGADFEKAKSILDAELAKPNLHKDLQAQLMDYKMQILMITAEDMEDIAAIKAHLMAIAEMRPEEAEGIKAFAAQIDSQAQQILDGAKQQREAIKSRMEATK